MSDLEAADAREKTRTVIVREYIQRRGQNDLCLCAAHLADIDADECSDGDDPDFCQIGIIDRESSDE